MDPAPLLELRGVQKSFPKPDRGELLVLDGIDLELHEGEIVGLLGRSGSGKSTLLRLVAGLAPASGGTIRCLGRPVNGPPEGVAMVFQSPALFPWLTVLENVELGLEAAGLPPAEARRRALAAIDTIGLDGFESAYPRELSGGMRQRVGFARAIVVHPAILLLDEPFSALDVLTAETLRSDFLDLWSDGRLPIQGMMLVTHNIEEAVAMCDRIVLFASDPGRIAATFPVELPQPRDRLDPSFRDLVERIYAELTARAPKARPATADGLPGLGIGTILPPVSTNLLAGFLEALAAPPFSGRADLPVLAERLVMGIDELFPVAETLQMLRLVELEGGDIHLTADGRRFVEADTDGRKALFAKQLTAFVPLAGHIRRVLDERPGHCAPWSRFAEELEDHMTPAAAERTLRAVIGWARWAELFAYDDSRRIFSLENP